MMANVGGTIPKQPLFQVIEVYSWIKREPPPCPPPLLPAEKFCMPAGDAGDAGDLQGWAVDLQISPAHYISDEVLVESTHQRQPVISFRNEGDMEGPAWFELPFGSTAARWFIDGHLR